jgi:hypothetical protein
MKKRLSLIDVTPVRQEVVSATEFVRITRDSPHLIAGSRFVPPTIGRRDFGGFDVRYSVPILKHKQIA